eukprot:c17598_g1_i2.p1 GENE.c17598_g1_i2~~c17598_g1_i2.p1  ORF type:complete len:1211 (+),score=264.59 c17598_g1_i2:346-3633(+)
MVTNCSVNQTIVCVELAPAGDVLFLGCENGTVQTFDIKKRRLSSLQLNVASLLGQAHTVVTCVATNPSKEGQLLVGTSNSTMVLCDLARSKIITKFQHSEETSAAVTSVGWCSSGKIFAAGYSDGTLTVWLLKNTSTPHILIYPFANSVNRGGAVTEIHFASFNRIPHAPLLFVIGEENKVLDDGASGPVQKRLGLWAHLDEHRAIVTGTRPTQLLKVIPLDISNPVPRILNPIKFRVQDDVPTAVTDVFRVRGVALASEFSWTSKCDDANSLILLTEPPTLLFYDIPVDIRLAPPPALPRAQNPPFMALLVKSARTPLLGVNPYKSFIDQLRSIKLDQTQQIQNRNWPLRGGAARPPSSTTSTLLVTLHTDNSLKFWSMSSRSMLLVHTFMPAALASTALRYNESSLPTEQGFTLEDSKIGLVAIRPETRLVAVAFVMGEVVLFEFDVEGRRVPVGSKPKPEFKFSPPVISSHSEQSIDANQATTPTKTPAVEEGGDSDYEKIPNVTDDPIPSNINPGNNPFEPLRGKSHNPFAAALVPNSGSNPSPTPDTPKTSVAAQPPSPAGAPPALPERRRAPATPSEGERSSTVQGESSTVATAAPASVVTAGSRVGEDAPVSATARVSRDTSQRSETENDKEGGSSGDEGDGNLSKVAMGPDEGTQTQDETPSVTIAPGFGGKCVLGTFATGVSFLEFMPFDDDLGIFSFLECVVVGSYDGSIGVYKAADGYCLMSGHIKPSDEAVFATCGTTALCWEEIALNDSAKAPSNSEDAGANRPVYFRSYFGTNTGVIAFIDRQLTFRWIEPKATHPVIAIRLLNEQGAVVPSQKHSLDESMDDERPYSQDEVAHFLLTVSSHALRLYLVGAKHTKLHMVEVENPIVIAHVVNVSNSEGVCLCIDSHGTVTVYSLPDLRLVATDQRSLAMLEIPSRNLSSIGVCGESGDLFVTGTNNQLVRINTLNQTCFPHPCHKLVSNETMPMLSLNTAQLPERRRSAFKDFIRGNVSMDDLLSKADQKLAQENLEASRPPELRVIANTQTNANDARSAVSQARQLAIERGEKLSKVQDQSEQLANHASDFAQLARELARQQENKKWWQL